MRIDAILSQQYILKAFDNLIKKNPAKNITVTDICNEAGVTRVTFYKYFKDYEDLVFVYTKYVFEDFIEKLKSENTKMSTVEGITKFLELCQQYSFKLQNPSSENSISRIYYKMTSSLRDIFGFENNKCLEDQIRFDIITSSMFTIGVRWVQDGMKEDKEEVAKIVHKTLFN